MIPRKSTLLKLAIAVSLSAFLLACGSKINPKNYAKIQNGMTMEEVKAILGSPTTSSTSGIGALSGTSAIWKSRDGTSISINFVNSKVLLKRFAEKK
jgi:hypothetical protein